MMAAESGTPGPPPPLSEDDRQLLAQTVLTGLAGYPAPVRIPGQFLPNSSNNAGQADAQILRLRYQPTIPFAVSVALQALGPDYSVSVLAEIYEMAPKVFERAQNALIREVQRSADGGRSSAGDSLEVDAVIRDLEALTLAFARDEAHSDVYYEACDRIREMTALRPAKLAAPETSPADDNGDDEDPDIAAAIRASQDEEYAAALRADREARGKAPARPALSDEFASAPQKQAPRPTPAQASAPQKQAPAPQKPAVPASTLVTEQILAPQKAPGPTSAPQKVSEPDEPGPSNWARETASSSSTVDDPVPYPIPFVLPSSLKKKTKPNPAAHWAGTIVTGGRGAAPAGADRRAALASSRRTGKGRARVGVSSGQGSAGRGRRLGS